MSPTSIVAYLVLFAAVGLFFVLAALLLGWFIRPKAPSPAKLQTYECGEPSIGSSFIQFDLRFYVVALVFIVFDVEVAFFFPWAVVFGKATRLLSQRQPAVVAEASPGARPSAVLSAAAAQTLRELGVRDPRVPQPSAGVETNRRAMHDAMRRLARVAVADMAVFFGVLLVGFAYVWRLGDLDWVRAVSSQREAASPLPTPGLSATTS